KLSIPSVSIAHNMQAFAFYSPTLKNRLATYLRNKLFNFSFIERLMQVKSLDFIGLNYYSRNLVDVKKWFWSNLLLDACPPSYSGLPKNSLGWDIYPQGLYSLLRELKKYKLPVFILENGICTEDDQLRWNFIRQHLNSIYLAMQEGVEVLGYIYWSLMDNFEWDKGFGARFGLIGIDYTNFDRCVRESAKKLAQVCKTNKLI
ncbi:MAG: glycosyl hydrolase family protein, partial [Candidatus Omnitrophica bacterium]|nr:glycosyl hydrolase family protein [Candidatus Omnitrophota bacterium]